MKEAVGAKIKRWYKRGWQGERLEEGGTAKGRKEKDRGVSQRGAFKTKKASKA